MQKREKTGRKMVRFLFCVLSGLLMTSVFNDANMQIQSIDQNVYSAILMSLLRGALGYYDESARE